MATLDLLKLDLCLSTTARDSYLTALINAQKNELLKTGVIIDEAVVDDQMLLSDWCAWKYRTRENPTAVPNYLKLRLMNKKTAKRGSDGG